MMCEKDVVTVLKSLGVRASKRLGQHFLLDGRIAERHVAYADIGEGETVLEIGPGLGVLTELLCQRAKKVVAIEKDRRLCGYLLDKLDNGRLDIINGDALTTELPEFDRSVSNLPYQISSPITFRLLDSRFKMAVLMYQKEFAERMIAGVGDDGYSRLSVTIYYRADCELLEHVPKEVFYPRPEVDSAIVSLRPRPPPFRVRDEKAFADVVNVLFSHRRKTVENALYPLLSRKDAKGEVFPFRKRRVEELSPEEIGELSDRVSEILISSKNR